MLIHLENGLLQKDYLMKLHFLLMMVLILLIAFRMASGTAGLGVSHRVRSVTGEPAESSTSILILEPPISMARVSGLLLVFVM